MMLKASASDEKNLSELSPVDSHIVQDNTEIVEYVLTDGDFAKGDVDEAMNLAMAADHRIISPEENKRLLRKIDLYLLPLLCLLYAVQFMDKVSNSNASIMGLKTDLDMTGDKYTWVGTSFYLGYMAFEFPVSTILQRFLLAKTTAAFIFTWGIVLCLHATPNYPGFIFLRTTLGALESSVTPAMVILTSQWYKKEEQFFRTCIWFACNGFGNILGSSIAYGIALRVDDYSIEGWKILFIATGLMTIVLSVCFFFHIPDTPADAWFLTDDEKLMVVERIRSNNQGFGNKHFKKDQFIEALCDIRTWNNFFFGLINDIPNGGTTNFVAILMKDDFGYSTLDSLRMGMITGAIELVGCPIFGYFHGYFPHRLMMACIANGITLVGACMLAFSSEDKKAQLAGYFITGISPLGMIACLSLFSSNVAGHTKKITVNAIYLIGYCVGNIIGPQTFRSSDAPTYTPAKITIAACYAVNMLQLVWMYWSYWNENKQRARKLAEIEKNGIVEERIDNMEFADLTDKQNPFFVYAL